MAGFHSFVGRVLAGTGLAAAVVGAAILGRPTVSAQPFEPFLGTIIGTPPMLVRLAVEPGGTEATLLVRGSEPTTVSHSVHRVTAVGGTGVPPRVPEVARPLGGSVLAPAGPRPAPVYDKEHRIRLGNLQSNTTYEVVVTAGTVDGQSATVRQRFTTLKERLRITLEEITIEDDGDGLFTGDGDPLWRVDLTYPGSNTTTLCFPNLSDCDQYGTYGEGRITPRTSDGKPLYWLLAEEVSPLPDELTLMVRAYEDDVRLSGACVGFCDETIPAETTYRRPQNVESVTNRVQVRGDDGEGFRSVLTFTFETYHDALDMSQF